VTTLYLKYRPQTLEELDLTDVRETLKKIVASGSIPQALLFYGPKGSGKTSAARIIAKIVNCLHPKSNGEPCNKCEQCISISKGANIDVIELDAASHRGIDDARMIKDAVKLSPVKAKKKVYIIDEAHMLTTEASNALLKTLEEPPEHVIFILATTNPEKLIDTVKSRTLNINFPKASDDEIIRAISKTLKGEKVRIEKRSLILIAKASDGSFREAHKIVENLIAKGSSFTAEALEAELFRNASTASIENIISGLSRYDDAYVVSEIEKLVKSGAKVELLTANLIDRLRSALFSKMGLGGVDLVDFSKEDLIYLIALLNKSYTLVSKSYLEQIPLELATVKWCQKGSKKEDLNVNGEGVFDKKKGPAIKKTKADTKKESNVKTRVQATSSDNCCISEDIWKQILLTIKPKNTSTEALLRAARPVSYDGKILTLGVYYSFHKERLEDVFHRQILEEVATKVIGSSVKVECQLTEAPRKAERVTHEDDSSGNGDFVSSSKSVSPASSVVLTEPDSVLTEPDDEDIIKIAKEIFGN
jgi:DNA polymerase-3 subunit gamma/tau